MPAWAVRLPALLTLGLALVACGHGERGLLVDTPPLPPSHSRRAAPTNVDPLDIEVTKNWEQIIAEVWAAVSHGRVPSLPVPVILGDNDDVDADALEAEAYADKENTKRAKRFIKAANKKEDLSNGEDMLSKDKRCEDLWKILDKHVDAKINATFVEVGAGSNLYVKAREEHVEKSANDNGGVPSWRARRSREAKHPAGSLTVRGCLSIRAARARRLATVLYVGERHHYLSSVGAGPAPAVDEDDEDNQHIHMLMHADQTGSIRNKLQDRPINHAVCNAPITEGTVNAMVEDTGELYTYQAVTEIRSLVNNMLPHEFERFLGTLFGLSITTFIPTPLPDDHFFSYWKSAEDLAKAAAHSVGLTTKVETLRDNSQPHYSQFSWQVSGTNKIDLSATQAQKLDGVVRVQLTKWVNVKKKKEEDKKEDKKKKKGEDDEEKGKKKKDDDEKKGKKRRRLLGWWGHREDHKKEAKATSTPTSTERKLVPFNDTLSDSGVSLATLKLLKISTEDSSQIFLNLLRSADANTMAANTADQIRFVRGALEFTKGANGRSNIRVGVDSAERDSHPSLNGKGAEETQIGKLFAPGLFKNQGSADDQPSKGALYAGEQKESGYKVVATEEPKPDESGYKVVPTEEQKRDDSGYQVVTTGLAKKNKREMYLKLRDDEGNGAALDEAPPSYKKMNTDRLGDLASPPAPETAKDAEKVKHEAVQFVENKHSQMPKGSPKKKNVAKPWKKPLKKAAWMGKAKAPADKSHSKFPKMKTLRSYAQAKEQETKATPKRAQKKKAKLAQKKKAKSAPISIDASEVMDGDADSRRRRRRRLLGASPGLTPETLAATQRWIRRPITHHRDKKWSGEKIKGQLHMIQHEEKGYERWWPLFESDEVADSTRRSKASWSILINGENLGLLSTKLALAFPKATVVSIKDDTNDLEAHLNLLKLLNVNNNILCNGRTRMATEKKHADEQTTRYGILGMDAFQVFFRNAHKIDEFESLFGSLLHQSATTFMELPDWDALMAAVDAMSTTDMLQYVEQGSKISALLTARYLELASSKGSADPWVGMLSAAAQAAGLTDVSMRMLPASKQKTGVQKVRSAILKRLRRKMPSNAPRAEKSSLFPKKPSKGPRIRIVRIDSKPWAKRGSSKESIPTAYNHEGVSVYALRRFGMIPLQTASIFRLFMKLPFHKIEKEEGTSAVIAPWNTYYHGSGGGYRGAFPRVLVTFGTTGNAYEAYNVPENEEAEEDAEKLVDPRWATISQQMTPEDVGSKGEFSYLEVNSGSGLLSLALAEKYPAATILSLESEKGNVEAHLKRIKSLGQSRINDAGSNQGADQSDKELRDDLAKVAANNWVCNTEVDLALLQKLYESPEFIRWLVFGGDLVLDHMVDSGGPGNLKEALGYFMSSGMTTFLQLPSAQSLSLGLYMFYHSANERSTSNALSNFALAAHPRPRYMQAEMQLLSAMAEVPGKTKLSIELLPGNVHMARVDVVNMTRHVNHHFDYKKDGHSRKYDMHVEKNETVTASYQRFLRSKALAPKKAKALGAFPVAEGQHYNRKMVTDVYITRQHDKWHIPYGQLWGVTLITVLRLGLVESQRAMAYHRFINLPLYEDMAPWNIVFQGARMAYIDYDTKDVTYDKVVPLTYRVLSVLFNYKRTVEDFKRCGPSSHNDYGFPHINSCVGGKIKNDFVSHGGKKCKESNAPVPCGDGTCRSDYISCLKVLSKLERKHQKQTGPGTAKSSAAALMNIWRTHEWTFGQKGLRLPKEEESG
jgi:hypothetical protein